MVSGFEVNGCMRGGEILILSVGGAAVRCDIGKYSPRGTIVIFIPFALNIRYVGI